MNDDTKGVESSSRFIQKLLDNRYVQFLLFMCMGSGANWVFPTALAQQIPYFENNLPEKLCIATYMNATTNFGFIAMLAYLSYHRYIGPIPYEYSVPSLLVLSSLGCFISGGVYDITSNGASFMLYLCCALGGTIGALSSVIMNPFMTQYQSSFISAARSGGSGLSLICAFVAIIQNPGSSHERFSTIVYMSIFGILLSFAFFAYHIIISYNIGKRLINETTSLHEKYENVKNPIQIEMSSDSVAEKVESIDDGNTKSTKTDHYLYSYVSIIELGFENLLKVLISENLHTQYPWLRKTIPYMLTIGWVNFNTWGIITAVIPFAMANSSQGSGSLNLSIAYQIATFMLVAGDLSTTVFKLPILPSLLVFTCFCIVVYSAALTSVGFDNPAAAPFIILVYSIERFLEAHVVTSTYRAIANDFPIEYKQLASRAVGISDQISTTTGALLSTLIVSLLISCHSSDDT